MEPNELASDLDFVRQAVERNDSGHRSPRAISLGKPDGGHRDGGADDSERRD